MKKHSGTILLVLIFFVGLAVMLYPTISDYINQRNQTRVVNSYAQQVDGLSDADYTAYFDAADVFNQEIAADPFFTPRESLEVQAGMYGVPPAERRTMELLNALGLGGVDAKVLLQGEDFGSLFVGGRLMLQQIVQQALAQGTVGDFQLGNVQLLHHGQHDADAAGQHRAALFLEGGQAQLVNVARLQQQRFQVVQLVWGDNVAIHPQGGEDIPQRMGHG